MSGSNKTRSTYYSQLNDESKECYDEKVLLIGDVNPYCRMEAKGKSTAAAGIVNWMNWPDVTHANIYS